MNLYATNLNLYQFITIFVCKLFNLEISTFYEFNAVLSDDFKPIIL